MIQGQLHFYRLIRSTRPIERVSDNSQLELNWPSVPDSLRLFLQRECDSPEQIQYRTLMLAHDSIYLRYLLEVNHTHLCAFRNSVNPARGFFRILVRYPRRLSAYCLLPATLSPAAH